MIGRELLLEQALVDAELKYKNDRLDIDFSLYVDENIARVRRIDWAGDQDVLYAQLRESGEITDRYVAGVLRGNPRRNWILLKSLQGHLRLAATYKAIDNMRLHEPQLRQAEAVVMGLGEEARVTVLPGDFAMLKGAIGDFTLAETLRDRLKR